MLSGADQTFVIPGWTSTSPAIAYWKFDEGYGTTANDTSGNENALTITNALWKTDELCRDGKCLFYDGTGDYSSRLSDSELNFGAANGITISGWFKHPSTISAQNTIVAKYNSSTGTDGGYKVYLNSSGYACFGIDDDSTWNPDDSACTESSYADSRWHYFTAIKTAASQIAIYIDGNRVGYDNSLSASSTLENYDAFYVGIDGDGSSTPFTGFIDELKVYRYARSEADIKTDFTSGGSVRGVSTASGPDNSFLSNGLVGYWKMDEKVADLCTGAFNDVCDSSGNGIDGAHEGSMSASGVNQTKKYGESLHFDNTDDRTNFGDANHLDFGDTDDFTISIWFNRDTFISDDTILAKSNAQSGSQGFIVWIDDANDDVNFAVTDGSSNSYSMNGITATTATGWHNIIIVYDQDSDVNSTIYFDGKVDKQSSTGTITSVGSLGNALDFMLGTESDLGNPYSGELDETRIYKRVLTPVEAVAVYNWAPGPVGYWSFDDNTGSGSGVVKDRSGNSNNGTTNGGISSSNWVPGKFGSAMTFDGTDDYVAITDPGTASMLDIDAMYGLTLEAWIKPTVLPSSGACYTILTKGAVDATDDVDYQILICEDGAGGYELDFYSNGAWRFTSATLQAKVWQHVEIKIGFGYENTYFYLNGVQIGTAGGHVPVTQNKAIWIGAQNSVGGAAVDSPFNGAIDEVKIYDYERTAGQIVEDMNAGHPAPGSPVGSPTLWWKFDEGADNTCADGADDACNSGSGGTTLDGTRTGGDWDNDGKYGKAVNMWGADDKISAGDVSFTDSLTQMTISMWVYPDALTDAHDYISKWNTTSQNSFRVGVPAGGDPTDEIRVNIPSSLTNNNLYFQTTNFDLATSVWTHLTVVYDGTLAGTERVKVYKNAQIKNGSVANGPIPTSLTSGSTSNLTLGDSDTSGGQPTFGSYDEVKIYTSALTADQVKLEYNQGKTAVWGAKSTDTSGVGSWSARDEYCPPGNTEGNCAAGQNPSPVGEWKLDENTGTNARDTSGNGYNGTLTGSPLWSNAKYGTGLSTSPNGTLQYVTVSDPGSGDLDFSNSVDYTLETWVRFTAIESAGAVYIIRKNLDGNPAIAGYGLSITTAGGAYTPACNYCDGAGGTCENDSVIGSTNLNNGQWHHLACVMDRNGSEVGTAGLYTFVDGNLFNSDTSLTEGTAVNGSAFEFGEHSTTDEMTNGGIDGVKVFRHARSQSQIAWDMNQGSPVAWWRMDENTGSAANDASGNGFSGTISGATFVTGKRNYALNFDGTDDYVDMNDVDLLGGSSYHDFSITGWFNRDTSNSDDTILANRNSPTENADDGFIVYIDDSTDKLTFEVSDDADTDEYQLESSSTIISTGWNHFTIVWDDSSVSGTKMYINGIEENVTRTGTLANVGTFYDDGGNVDLRIGGESDTATDSPFDGKLDDIRIYRYALNQQQINGIISEGALRFAPNEGSP